MGTLTTMFVDLNSYFASVEQQLHPELRGRPVAVIPVLTDSTSCIAASYEAKAFGVRTGTRVGDAKRLCPGITFVMSRTGEYVRMHHRVLEAAETVLPVHAVHSIDEFSCRLLGKQRERGEAERLALAVKRAIAERVGVCMRCSIGVAPNRILAKLASDMMKPDGLVIIEKHELPERLLGLDVRELSGVGPRMAQRLARHGVSTMADLYARSAVEMERMWESVLGRWWYEALRGEDMHERATIRRTIGHQHVLAPELRSGEGSRAVAIRLLMKAATRARSLGYVPRRLSVSVRHVGDRGPDGGRTSRTWGDGVSFPDCDDTITLVELLTGMWAGYEGWVREGAAVGVTPLRVSVTLEDLVPRSSSTLNLFAEARERAELSKAMDTVNAKYGKNAVYLGSMHQARSSAPSRIAFSSIPDATWEEVGEGEDGLV